MSQVIIREITGWVK